MKTNQPTPDQTGKGRYLLVSLFVVAFDQWSKWLVEEHLPPHLPKTIIPGFLNFTHVKNTGVAFGLFAAQGDLVGTAVLTALGLAALAIVGWYFWKTSHSDRLLLLSLGLILGGAIGNLIDRVATGAVTDFVDAYVGTYHWHTFNVADSAITIGIVLMAIDILLARSPDPEPDGSPSTPRRG